MNLGLGVGWRPQLAMHIERRDDLGFIEILADNHFMDERVKPPISYLKDKGLKIVIHSIGLSLGGASLPSLEYIEELNRLDSIYGAVLFSEHIAFVRSGGREAGHLLPVKRTEQTLKVLIENINFTRARLSKPLVLENIASFVEWPGNTIEEADFLAAILKETDCDLLLDISNLYANSVNNQFDPAEYLDKLPLNRVKYMHVAGGVTAKGIYHDTHSHAVSKPIIDLLKLVCGKISDPAVLLERDDQFPMQKELFEELDLVKRAINQKEVVHA